MEPVPGLERLLVANRGEVAVRVLRAAAELGIATVAVHSEDDARSLHVRLADEVRPLRGAGPSAYLDIGQVVEVAVAAGCDAIHPGWGFLSERADLARACAGAGVRFVGPNPGVLDLFGDKTAGRQLAVRCGVPVLAGTPGSATLAEARDFMASLPEGSAAMIKAVAGGGGRGMRLVDDLGGLADAFERCRSEAMAAFGNGDVLVEQFLPAARHIEVQIVGDAGGAVSHIGERECSLQRRHQKLIEVAPSPALTPERREAILSAAVRMATEVGYDNIGTFEFLVDAASPGGAFFFIEANPRLQVEHTVTEEVTGIDLVQVQLRIAGGATLAELQVDQQHIPEPRGFALQARVNTETMTADGGTRPAGGTLAVFEPPSGPGVRVDTYGYAGYTTNPRFDSLLAKVVVHSRSTRFADAVTKADRALSEFRVDGVATNLPFLQSLLQQPEVIAGDMTTRFVDERAGDLVAMAAASHRPRYFDTRSPSAPGRAGARIDSVDPLAVLHHGKSPETVGHTAGSPSLSASVDDDDVVTAPMQGTIVTVDVVVGDPVAVGQQLLVMEAMKMEHVITADRSGVVRVVAVGVGDTVFEGHALLAIEEADVDVTVESEGDDVDLDTIRPDLQEVLARHEIGLDDARPDAVARRQRTGQRTARENVDDLCDAGSFVEYGPMVIAGQRRRRSVEDLVANTPADGLVAGIGTVNAGVVGEEAARCVVMAYDYTVLAGTQGLLNHRKKDRMFELAERWRLPVVFFTEGGGGRPGDTDGDLGLDTMAFHLFGRLSGLVPLVGITSGRCFAGNAALLGCCDVVIATKGSNIGMGGPAMIEGGGLGVFRPEEVGPLDVQVANGVVDLPVADEAEAVAVAKRYLSYFQGPLTAWECADQRHLRRIVPENRLRVYDVRQVVETLADTGSVLELRRAFGPGMVTALARIEGRSVGIVANNPTHLAGAIDSDGADKAARFLQLCDAFGLPVVFLCDTPGIMVGPEVEKTALVRHASRMFVVGANVTVPVCTIVLRKAYGLGAQAMAGGSFKAAAFTVSWPTGEFGGMGLEGAVKLGFRKELAAVEDPAERRALFDQMVARMYEYGKALSTATHFEVDDVIDPADSRRWITTALTSAAGSPAPRPDKKRSCIDTW